LPHTPSNSSALKTPENLEGDHDAHEPAAEGDIPMEYFSDYLYSQNIGAVTKNCL
jgi:hypothetical protein